MQTKSSEDSDGVWWLGQDGAAELTSLITTSSSFLSFLCPARRCRPGRGGGGRRGGSRPNSNESVLSRAWPGTEVLLLVYSLDTPLYSSPVHYQGTQDSLTLSSDQQDRTDSRTVSQSEVWCGLWYPSQLIPTQHLRLELAGLQITTGQSGDVWPANLTIKIEHSPLSLHTTRVIRLSLVQ